MPDNDVEGIDYMADEVDILDFVMEDDEVNGGGAQFADDYDMVIHFFFQINSSIKCSLKN